MQLPEFIPAAALLSPSPTRPWEWPTPGLLSQLGEPIDSQFASKFNCMNVVLPLRCWEAGCYLF